MNNNFYVIRDSYPNGEIWIECSLCYLDPERQGVNEIPSGVETLAEAKQLKQDLIDDLVNGKRGNDCSHCQEVIVSVSDGYHWTWEGTPEGAAKHLAERSHNVLLHVEPVHIDGDDEQNEIRRLYFEHGGEAELPDCEIANAQDEQREFAELNGDSCPECKSPLTAGYVQNSEFRPASFVPQQYSGAKACLHCRICWSVAASAALRWQG